MPRGPLEQLVAHLCQVSVRSPILTNKFTHKLSGGWFAMIDQAPSV